MEIFESTRQRPTDYIPTGRDCRDCGNEIPVARLQLVPTTWRCIHCAIALEARP
ncbi:TraR/DksA family transcriptional regulator [Pseudonocardia sp. TMWB2A]|uniref:TraR/DksA C4-type zinc finger protein n=1 Tax=Pseudonocardia sp. TMWB2A TaxID=687430 RepID=UPI0030993107